MISIALPLMRLAGSVAGERWAQVCVPESVAACRRAARRHTSVLRTVQTLSILEAVNQDETEPILTKITKK